MCSFHKNNCNILIKELQEYLQKNFKKIGFGVKEKNNIIKKIRNHNISQSLRQEFFNICEKKIKNEVRKKRSHITFSEREVIELLWICEIKQSTISKLIGINRASICREIKKYGYKDMIITTKSIRLNPENEYKIIYESKISQEKSNINKLRSRKKNKLDKDLKLREIVVSFLKNQYKDKKSVRYSPEAISGLLKNNKIKNTTSKISAGTIYKAVHENRYGLTINDLPNKIKYYKKEKKKEEFNKTPERKQNHSIEKMPEEAKNKKHNFFWEGDSVIGVRNGKHTTVITLVNSVTKFLIATKSADKSAVSFVNVLNKLESSIKDFNKIIEILLVDNGVEFSYIKEIEESYKYKNKKRLSIYYSHAYSSYERGLNENTNGLLRRDLKKGVNMDNYTEEDVLNASIRLNNMPRKSLNWKTPLEAMEELLIENKIDTEWLNKYRIKVNSNIVA